MILLKDQGTDGWTGPKVKGAGNMGRTIAVAAVVFAMAVVALQHADLIGSFGEPAVLVAMGSLFIFLSRFLNPARGADDSGVGATVLAHPRATAA